MPTRASLASTTRSVGTYDTGIADLGGVRARAATFSVTLATAVLQDPTAIWDLEVWEARDGVTFLLACKAEDRGWAGRTLQPSITLRDSSFDLTHQFRARLRLRSRSSLSSGDLDVS